MQSHRGKVKFKKKTESLCAHRCGVDGGGDRDAPSGCRFGACATFTVAVWMIQRRARRSALLKTCGENRAAFDRRSWTGSLAPRVAGVAMGNYVDVVVACCVRRISRCSMTQSSTDNQGSRLE